MRGEQTPFARTALTAAGGNGGPGPPFCRLLRLCPQLLYPVHKGCITGYYERNLNILL